MPFRKSTTAQGVPSTRPSADTWTILRGHRHPFMQLGELGRAYGYRDVVVPPPDGIHIMRDRPSHAAQNTYARGMVYCGDVMSIRYIEEPQPERDVCRIVLMFIVPEANVVDTMLKLHDVHLPTLPCDQTSVALPFPANRRR